MLSTYVLGFSAGGAHTLTTAICSKKFVRGKRDLQSSALGLTEQDYGRSKRILLTSSCLLVGR